MFSIIRQFFRRCRFLVFRMSFSLAERIFLGPLFPPSVTQKTHCGRINVHLVDLGKGDIRDLSIKQKKFADITVSVIDHPALRLCVSKAFEKIKDIIIVYGRGQNRLLFFKVLFVRNPPLNDLRQSVRSLISFMLWETKFRDEYFVQCRSKEESRNSATEFMNQSMQEVDVAIAETMGAPLVVKTM